MTRQEAIEILTSLTCWCGRRKYREHAVCPHCWAKLTQDERDSLYLHLGKGFEIAYPRCVEILRRRIRPLKAVPAKNQISLFPADVINIRDRQQKKYPD